ncbi:uncharacterized protein LOC124165619 [Ischnura elegans]|uniref:uncharacterized protein LOC124165619 n=1 Tax=Ischnura elegans TaxID=197161 RepID=UPI001ED87E03|nr:uncharacterized protein LOC124165619 [Ischnura elegans]XP_046399040.1 uncharacterized protein LOC124165619 [Ischnura elegans]
MSSVNAVEEGETRKMRLIYPCFVNNQLGVFLNKVSETQFGEIYSCLSKGNKPWKGGSKTFKVFKDVVKKNSLTQFDDIHDTVKLNDKLSSVDDLRSRYSSNKDVVRWRPDGNVKKALYSHDMAEKLKRKAHLQGVVDKHTQEIEKLKSELNQICSQLKSENELDEELKMLNDESSKEMKNLHIMKQKMEEMKPSHPSAMMT